MSSGALPDADQSLVKSTKVNSRAINVEWTLHDASCADAGVYECQVGYFIDMRKMEKTYGQQHILPGKTSSPVLIKHSLFNFKYVCILR